MLGALLAITVPFAAAVASVRYSIGVDVGTGSARAGIIDVSTGEILAVKKEAIAKWEAWIVDQMAAAEGEGAAEGDAEM